MSKTAHRIFLGILVVIVFIALILLIYKGLSYYNLNLSERVYLPEHAELKPGGSFGHGYGIIGSLLIIIGMSSYMAKKRFRFLSRMGLLKHWLEFHIFLCTLGPILVLFHTSFKFGGLVAVSFWSMVAVFASGVIGRFIYLQIPRSIEGRELSLNEIRGMKSDVAGLLKETHGLDEESFNVISESVKKKVELNHKSAIVRYIRKHRDDAKSIRSVKEVLKRNKLSKNEYVRVLSVVREDIKLNRRIDRLETMQNLFKYWHVAHLPFAMVMLIIMVIHVGVTILFGYRWIF